MLTRTKLLSVLMIAVLLSIIWVTAPVSRAKSPSERSLPRGVNAKARLLAERLNRQGFEILHGLLELYTDEDCPASYQEMGMCYANNPAAPYVLVSLPPWKNECIDPATDTAFGYGKRAPYRLDPREAIVTLGRLPPQAKYFGLQSYLFTRQGKSDPYLYLAALNRPRFLSKFFTYVPQDHQRIIQFASTCDLQVSEPGNPDRSYSTTTRGLLAHTRCSFSSFYCLLFPYKYPNTPRPMGKTHEPTLNIVPNACPEIPTSMATITKTTMMMNPSAQPDTP